MSWQLNCELRKLVWFYHPPPPCTNPARWCATTNSQLSIIWEFELSAIDLIHKSHNAPVPYPKMHHSEQLCALWDKEHGLVWDWFIRHQAIISTISDPCTCIHDVCWSQGPVSLTLFCRNLNSMETSPCCNSAAGHQIATNFRTCHDSTAVAPCAKVCSDHCTKIEVRVKQNFHRM